LQAWGKNCSSTSFLLDRRYSGRLEILVWHFFVNSIRLQFHPEALMGQPRNVYPLWKKPTSFSFLIK
jgi:hypothetical protein